MQSSRSRAAIRHRSGKESSDIFFPANGLSSLILSYQISPKPRPKE